jgi:hypothetical protein
MYILVTNGTFFKRCFESFVYLLSLSYFYLMQEAVCVVNDSTGGCCLVASLTLLKPYDEEMTSQLSLKSIQSCNLPEAKEREQEPSSHKI